MPLAILRPSDWELPVFVHVLSAMVLVGALVLALTALLAGWKRDEPTLVRLTFRSLLLAALPAWIVMRVTGQWALSREDVDDEATWVGIGFITSEAGLLLLIAATILAGLAARRAGRTGEGAGTLGRVAAVLTSVLVVAYVVAMWAMTTKPGV